MKRAALVLGVVGLGVFALASIRVVGDDAQRVDAQRDVTAGHVLVALTGRESEFAQPRYFLAASQEVFDEHWTAHMGDRVEKAAQGWAMTPTLDFDVCEAVFVFGGDRVNCNGYRVVEVLEEVDAVTIRYELISYQTSAAPGEKDEGNAATPWAMFVIPVAGGRAIFLEEDVQGIIGRAPKWKQRVAFPGRIGVGRAVEGTGQR